jgi:hypothetical protein
VTRPFRTGASRPSARYSVRAAAAVWMIGPILTSIASVRVAHGDEIVAPSPVDPAAIRYSARLLVQTDVVAVHHGPDAPAIEDGTTHPGIYLRRARIGADATAGAWRVRIMVEAAGQHEIAGGGTPAADQPAGITGTTAGITGGLDPIAGEIAGSPPRATEAYLALAPHKGFAIAAGTLRVPIGLSRQIDEADLRLPERARIVTHATPDYRVGVAAAGDLGLFQYAAGTYAAAPLDGASFAGGGTLYVLRLSSEPVGPMGVAPQTRSHDDPWFGWWRFSVGLSALYAQLSGADELGLGGDGQFQWRGWCVAGELLWTRRSTADRVGFAIEPGVFLLPERLELVARAEWLNDEVGPRSPADAWGAAIGATFFSATRHARLQAAYSLRLPAAGGDTRMTGWALLRATFVL